MINRSIAKIALDLMRNSARAIYLISSIFIAIFVCWFCFWFLVFLSQWCKDNVFNEPW